jgi:TonB-linked SusC/RagA family outer membrane protein
MMKTKFILFSKFAILVLFLSLTFYSYSQEITIKGKVLDKSGLPLIGVAVQEVESTNGTLTDIDGLYTILVSSSKASLLFSYTSYQDQTILVGNNATIDVILSEDNELIQEVVVTALGIKKEKAKLGYATQEVDGKTLQKAVEANVATSLAGKIAGLTIFTKTNLYENPEIKLRGANTLVVIDGVPSETDFWNISPNDIESVNVLKGTAAAALYGSLGINGAIMITTKKGKSGENGVEITFNSSNQFQAGFIKIPETQKEYGMGWNGSYGFVDGKGAGLFDDYGYVFGPKLNQKDPTTKSGFVEIPQWNSEVDPATGKLIPLPWVTRGQDNLKDFLRNQFITTDNLSVAGKTDLGDYRLSLSHMYVKGQVPNTKLNSTTATLSGSVKLSSKIKAQSIISYNRQNSPNYPSAGYGADNYFYNILLWMGPEVGIKDLQNYWQPGKVNIAQKTYNYTWYNNPYYLANEYLKSYTNDVVTGQANISYDISKGLQFIARSGITNSNIFEDRKTPYTFIYYGRGASPQGNYSVGTNGRFQVISDVLLTWNKNIFDKLDATFSIGGSHRFNSNRGHSSRTAGLNVPGFFNLENSIAPVTSTSILDEKEVSSAYGYIDLNYNRMIYLSVTGRNDKTSTLQKPYNSFFYPSASLGLVLSEMTTMPSFISYAKLRGSWANVSTDVAPYYTIPTYQSSSRWNGTLSLELPGSLISKGLRPNQTISKEYGAEFKLFKSRLGFDFSYFDYDDKNFIIEAPLSPSTGYTNRLVNGGIVNRKGIELVLSLTPIKSKSLTWDIIANYGTANTFRQEYYGGEQILNGVKVGERSDVYRGWAWQRSPDGKIVTINGKPQYIDHAINLGFLDPDFSWGINNQFNFGNFGFNFSIDGRVGGKMYNGVEAKLYEGGTHPASANSYRDDSYAGNATFLLDGVVVTEGEAVWDIQGNLVSDNRKFAPNTTKVKYIDYLFDTYVNSIDQSVLYDRTFMKLREVALTYKLPLSLLNGKLFKEVNLSLIGRNLFLWTKVPFMDPDGYYGTTLSEPTYRNIGFNINCKF